MAYNNKMTTARNLPYNENACICFVDYDGPTHYCADGHHFREQDIPALSAISNRLTRCPVYHQGEKDYDDGVCGAELLEVTCWHTPETLEEMRLESRGYSL